ncbi:hypothetical protein BON30_11545 [Cystobacter ferrugineus]|uniref:Uncharacterized protein n=1 Tax=Cystobacter ferrugineus TaxID=83449 RepID=A0A1L9BGW7_9BACT|nr:hypothetical protein BON30_11545 [Cystobacter ferrugineus]
MGSLSFPCGEGILAGGLFRRKHPDGGFAERFGALGLKEPATGWMRLPTLEDGGHGLFGHSRVEVMLQIIERCAAPGRGKEQADLRPVLLGALRRMLEHLSHSSRVVEMGMCQDHELRSDAVVGDQLGAVWRAARCTTIDEKPVIGRRSNRHEFSDSGTE